MNGTTSSPGRTLGQLCTRLRFGNTVAADTMKRASAIIARCGSVHVCRPRDHGGRVADVGHVLVEPDVRKFVRRAPTTAGEVEGAFLALGGLGFAEQLDVDDARVGLRRVVRVAAEVLGADLPVAADPPALRPPQLHAFVALMEIEVEEEGEVTEGRRQRR